MTRLARSISTRGLALLALTLTAASPLVATAAASASTSTPAAASVARVDGLTAARTVPRSSARTTRRHGEHHAPSSSPTPSSISAPAVVLSDPAPACDDSWVSSTSGSWSTGADWSTGSAPTAAQNACIEVPGTYTVTLNGTATVNSLTLGAPSGGGSQVLAVQGDACATGTAELTLADGGSSTDSGDLQLTGTGCGSDNSAILDVTGGTYASAGTLEADNFYGGSRTIDGSVTNTGTITIGTNTTTGTTGTLDNEGTLNVADGVTYALDNGVAATLIDDTGGSITANGTNRTGEVVVGSGDAYQQGAGTTSGVNPIYVVGGSIDYTGSGSSSIIAQGSTSLSGDVATGQSLYVQGYDCGIASAQATASASFANAGLIDLQGEGCGASNSATLDIAAGTLTNRGTLQTDEGEGGTRTIDGNVTNTGTITINWSTTYGTAGSTLDNEGAINLNNYDLTVPSLAAPGATVVNDTGGSVSSSGSGAMVLEGGDTWQQGAGTISGATGTVTVQYSSVDYTGTGAGVVVLEGTSTLSGDVASGQTLDIEGVDCAIGSAEATASASFANAGTINLTGSGCGGSNSATLDIAAGTLTNKGVLQAINYDGGTRTIDGTVKNSKELVVDSGAKLTLDGTLTNYSALDSTLTGGKYLLSGTFEYENSGFATNDILVNTASVTLTGGSWIDQDSHSAFSNLMTNSTKGSLTLEGSSLSTAAWLDNDGKLIIDTGYTLAVGGSFTQSSSGKLTVTIGPSGAGKISADGDITVAGTSDVTAVKGFTSSPGDKYTVAQGSQEIGSFSTELGEYTMRYTTNDVVAQPVFTSGGVKSAQKLELTVNLGPTITSTASMATP